MLPGDSQVGPSFLALTVALIGAVSTCLLSLAYLRRVRVERPAIGRFNGRDIVILFIFIVGLPLLYLAIPLTVLLVLLGITFVSAMSIGLKPILGSTRAWLLVGLGVGVDIWMARTLLGTIWGWQVFWVLNSILVVTAAVSVANLYAQGGMRLRHVAWFTLILAAYDAIFTLVWPVTNYLAQRLIGYPMDPSVGFRMGIYNATIGIGDLLVYSLFVIISYKSYGRVAARLSMVCVLVFGIAVPALAPLVYHGFIDARTDVIVPAQTAFGPVAFLLYLWFKRRYGRERTMVEFLASADAQQPAAAPIPATTAETSDPVTVPELVDVVDSTRFGMDSPSVGAAPGVRMDSPEVDADSPNLAKLESGR